MRQRAASYSAKRGCYGSTIQVVDRCSYATLALNFSAIRVTMFLEILPHPGLRFALNASPFGRRRASLRPGCGS